MRVNEIRRQLSEKRITRIYKILSDKCHKYQPTWLYFNPLSLKVLTLSIVFRFLQKNKIYKIIILEFMKGSWYLLHNKSL